MELESKNALRGLILDALNDVKEQKIERAPKRRGKRRTKVPVWLSVLVIILVSFTLVTIFIMTDPHFQEALQRTYG